MPVAVYWGRAPQREKSWLGLMFSENWAFVGPFRRLLSIVFNGRSTLIRFGEPRSIRSYATAGPDARGARRLLKDMRAEFRHMRADTLGPDLSRQRAIIAGWRRPLGRSCAAKCRSRRIKPQGGGISQFAALSTRWARR